MVQHRKLAGLIYLFIFKHFLFIHIFGAYTPKIWDVNISTITRMGKIFIEFSDQQFTT